MKTITKPVYYCEHCKKHGLRKSAMEYHETICFHNPENFRPCYDCTHLVKRQTSIYIDQSDYGSDGEKMVDLFYCTKHEQFKYTPQNRIKENIFDLGDDFNEPMPKECIDFESREGFIQNL